MSRCKVQVRDVDNYVACKGAIAFLHDPSDQEGVGAVIKNSTFLGMLGFSKTALPSPHAVGPHGYSKGVLNEP
jgi:hypothetical protein